MSDRTPLLATSDPENTTTYTPEDDTGLEVISSVPIEKLSPLGYNVSFLNATLLNISGMIGTGIFSTSSLVLRSVGSVGMLLVLYIVAPLVTCAGLMIYVELASMCGHKRSGAEVVYLEQAYPRPKYLVSTTFAITTLLSGYAGMGSTVFAKHLLQAFEIESTPFRQKFIAIAHLSSAIATCMLGWSSIPNSGNLKNPFAGSSFEGNALATSFAKVNFSFVNWNAILSLTAEIPGRDPIRTAQYAGFMSVLVTSLLYLTTVVSFVVVMTHEELVDAGEVLGARFLRKVYGDAIADKLFLIIIGMSTFGGVLTVVSRFKTPYGPLALKWGLSVTLLLITPAKDTFSFLVDLASYPGLVREA
ncbi:hypothetical protein FRC06_003178 [Ceratobasidium sp. 370]|nr:hypothetical protein FRC06_003178 [Ceratobasidium sp. 370]